MKHESSHRVSVKQKLFLQYTAALIGNFENFTFYNIVKCTLS